jgi:hypothetical protein
MVSVTWKLMKNIGKTNIVLFGEEITGTKVTYLKELSWV